MRKTKKILSILLACMMLMSLLSVGTFAAEGDQDNPIDASTKWFGYGVDTYVLNPTISAGTDSMWYTLTAKNDGILYLEHSYKNVDYTIYVTLNGVTYEGGCVDGEPYNRPIVTAPLAAGDVATIQIATIDAAAGTVYASMNVIPGDVDNPIKVKSNGLSVVVGAGQTVYFQDDSLNAIYATKGLLVEGDVADTTFYTVAKNSESGTAVTKAFTDTDGDGIIETKLGGSLGSAGAPPVKPAWAIENNSNQDKMYNLIIVDAAHECVYDDDADMDCNSCGTMREFACRHTYDTIFDTDCNACGAVREVVLPLTANGTSISENKNGLAVRFDIVAEDLAMDANHQAIYDNATVNGMKLISMGAVVCNNYEITGIIPTLDDVNGVNVVNVSAKNLYALDKETNTASYAIRIIDIPNNQKDTTLLYVPYVIVEDNQGAQYTVYADDCVVNTTYNAAAAN